MNVAMIHAVQLVALIRWPSTSQVFMLLEYYGYEFCDRDCDREHTAAGYRQTMLTFADSINPRKHIHLFTDLDNYEIDGSWIETTDKKIPFSGGGNDVESLMLHLRATRGEPKFK